MTFSSQVILSIFFLYVVIISEQLFSIISCKLQKLIIDNIYFKHLFIFLNIFLFTFVLGWYTENSIYAVKNNNQQNNEQFDKCFAQHARKLSYVSSGLSSDSVSAGNIPKLWCCYL